MRIPVVELSECLRCEVCSSVAPAVFHQNEMGFIEVALLTRYPEEEISEAIKNCPAACIAWQEE